MFFYDCAPSNTQRHAHVQMCDALCNPQQRIESEYQWQAEFYSLLMKTKGIELPVPCIYQKKVYFSGGLHPPGTEPPTYESIYIADRCCNHIRVLAKETRLPNDAEYNKFYRHLIEGLVYRIISKEKNGGCSVMVFTKGFKK